MKYDFDHEIAKKVGVEAAIVYSNIYWWCKKNEVEESEYHFHEGRYWTFNSEKAWSKLFPFWSVDQMGRILKKLEESGFIISCQMNKNKWDRTKWFSPRETSRETPPIDEAISPHRGDDTASSLPNTVNKQQLVNGKPPQKKENESISRFFEDIEAVTGLPPTAGLKSRQFAWNLLRALQKVYPDLDANLMARRVVEISVGLQDSWHTPKSGDPKHLFYNWQEIVTKAKVASKTPQRGGLNMPDFRSQQ